MRKDMYSFIGSISIGKNGMNESNVNNQNKSLHPNEILEIELELTGTCNLQCPLCTRNYSHAKHQLVAHQRTLTDVINQLNSFPNLKHINIAGTVSEPTLYKDFLPLMEYLTSRDLSIDLYSNASILNEQLWKTVGTIFTKEKQRVIFTICGSTQELHQKYRVGSKLENVLANANAFKQTNKSKSDWMQYIIFEYNEKDAESKETHDILIKFSYVQVVGSEGQRLKNEYNKPFSEDIRPAADRKKKIDTIFQRGRNIISNRLKPNNYQLWCKSFRQQRIYIDQFGNIYACYNIAEYYPNQTLNIIDSKYDFNQIHNFINDDCFKCEKSITNFIKVFNVDFVC